MGVTLAYSQRLETTTCPTCGTEFGVSEYLIHTKRKNAGTIYCPNGHRSSWGESEADRLQKELDKQKERTRWAEEETRKVTARLKKTETRIAHGVCPCCNRAFTNLQRHMKTKHKEFVEPAK